MSRTPTVPRVSQEHCPGCPQWAHAAQMTGEELSGHAAARSLQTAQLTHRPTRCCLKHSPVWSGLSRLLQLGHADSSLGCWPRLPGCLDAASSKQVCRASSPMGENSDGDRCGQKGGERMSSWGAGPGRNAFSLAADTAQRGGDVMVWAFLVKSCKSVHRAIQWQKRFLLIPPPAGQPALMEQTEPVLTGLRIQPTPS